MKAMVAALILFLAVALLLCLSPAPAAASTTSAYDLLKAHGLPVGLLPKGVAGVTVDEPTGRFEVQLPVACTARFETEVRYDRNVTGTISYGQITALSGITAQELFLWFPVRGIRVDVPSSGLIYFDVGVIYKQFSLSLFESPPDCAPTSPDPHAQSRIANYLSRPGDRDHRDDAL